MFLTLPDDLCLEILQFCSVKDLNNMALVCKDGRKLSNHSLLWKKHSAKEIGTPFKIEGKEQYIKSWLAKKHLLLNWLETSAIDSMDCDAKESITSDWKQYIAHRNNLKFEELAKKHFFFEKLTELKALFQTNYQCIWSLPSNFFDQNNINFLHKVSAYTEAPLPREMEEKFINLFDFSFTNNNEYANFSYTLLSMLLGAFRIESNLFSNFLLTNHPALPKLKFSKRLGCSVLHNAIDDYCFEKAKILIEKGADINLSQTQIIYYSQNSLSINDTGYSSPLYGALYLLTVAPADKIFPIKDFIQYLLSKGADSNAWCLDFDEDINKKPCDLAKVIEAKCKDHPKYPLIYEACLSVVMDSAKRSLQDLFQVVVVDSVKKHCNII